MVGPSEIVVLLLILLIVVIAARYRTKRICPNCGFAIQTYARQCPECGIIFPRKEPTKRRE